MVSVSTEGETCTAYNNYGEIEDSNITDVSILCSMDEYSIGGNVSGLTGGKIVLQNNGTDDLTITKNGSFTFSRKVANGAKYSVQVRSEPAGLKCTPSDNTGRVHDANVTDVKIECSKITYTVGGTVTGLDGTVTLRNNDTDEIKISANGPFTFPARLAKGSSYSVTVRANPADQSCVVTNGTGKDISSNITNVAVNCTGAPTLWGKTVVSATADTSFMDAASDSEGNAYVAGEFEGKQTVDLGSGVTLKGAADDSNYLLAKYTKTGAPVWGKTTVSGPGGTRLSGIAELNGYLYAVGDIYTSESGATYDLGGYVLTTPPSARDLVYLSLVMKIDASNGNIIWAKTVKSAPDVVDLNHVAVDASGGVYAVGSFYGKGTLDFGDGVSFTGGTEDKYSLLIVSYDENGTAKWAKTASGSGYSVLIGVSAGPDGGVYVAGNISNGVTTNMGDGKTITPVCTGCYGRSYVLAKYDQRSGATQWATTVAGASNTSGFNDVSAGSDGNIYAAGYSRGNGEIDFGNGVVLRDGLYKVDNGIVVKYTSSGKALWARSFSFSEVDVYLDTTLLDTAGNIYVTGAGSMDRFYLAGAFKLDSSGVQIWSKVTLGEIGYDVGTLYMGGTLDKSGNMFLTGNIAGSGTYIFGDNVVLKGLLDGHITGMLIKIGY